MSQSLSDAQEKTIDGETFRVRMLDPLVAIDLEVDILQALGPAIGTISAAALKAKDSKKFMSQLLDGAKEQESSTTSTMTAEEIGSSMSDDSSMAIGRLIGEGIEGSVISLVDRLSKDKLREVIGIMESVTCVKKGDGWPELSSIFPIFFRGRLKLMHKWLAFAIRSQYRDF